MCVVSFSSHLLLITGRRYPAKGYDRKLAEKQKKKTNIPRQAIIIRVETEQKIAAKVTSVGDI